jgi:hypothetical protein
VWTHTNTKKKKKKSNVFAKKKKKSSLEPRLRLSKALVEEKDE